MFAKLKTTAEGIQYTEKESDISYGGIISYSNVEVSNPDNLLKILPEVRRPQFQIALLKVNGTAPAHTDSNVLAAINFYIKPEAYNTIFYKAGPNADKYQLPNQTNGYVYTGNDLTEIGSFVADINDVWVLDVTKPHAVVAQDSSSQRLAISLMTSEYSYDYVCAMLRTNGYL